MEKIFYIGKYSGESSFGLTLGFADDREHNCYVPVLDVLLNGPAHRAGIVKGDLVSAINGIPLYTQNLSTIQDVIGNSKKTILTVTVYSNTSKSYSDCKTLSASNGSTGDSNINMSLDTYTSPPTINVIPTQHPRRNSESTLKPGFQSSDVHNDDGEENIPKLICKPMRYTPERSINSSSSPKITIKKSYQSPNLAQPDLLNASKRSSSARSLQHLKSPMSSPMYVREFEEEVIDSYNASPSPQPYSSSAFFTQPRREQKKNTPNLCAKLPSTDAPLYTPSDDEFLTSPSPPVSHDKKPKFYASSIPANGHANLQVHSTSPHSDKSAKALHIHTPHVRKLKNVLGESTPVVRNALRATVDRGHLSHGNRRAQSVDALDSSSMSPPPGSPVNNSSSPVADLNSVQFSITVDKISATSSDGKGQLASTSLQNDAAYLRFEKDATVSILPVSASSSHFEHPLSSLNHLRPETLSPKKRRLRVVTADYEIKVKHDDYRYIRALYERLTQLKPPGKSFPVNHKNLKPSSPRSGPKSGAKMLSSASVDETSSSPTGASSGKPFKLALLKNIKLWSNRDPKLRSPESATASKNFSDVEGSYGMPLHMCPMSGKIDGVPLIVQLCCCVVEAMGIRREGIYRVSGNAKNIELLEAEFSKNSSQIDLDSDLWLKPNVVASVLKRFLLQLPDPLIPSVYYNDFMQTQRLSNRNDRMLKLHRLLGVMEDHVDYPHHKCHRKTLQYLVDHLYKVTQFSSKNKMKLYNLSMVFAPSLFGQRDQDAMMTDSLNLINLTKTIILYKDWLFADWQTADLSLPPEVSEEEFDAPTDPTAFERAMSPEPSEKDLESMEIDRVDIFRVVRDVLNSALLNSSSVKQKQQQWAKPVYNEVDIDAEISKRKSRVPSNAVGSSSKETPPQITAPVQRLSSRTDSSLGGDSDLEEACETLRQLQETTDERLRQVTDEKERYKSERNVVQHELRKTLKELMQERTLSYEDRRHGRLIASRSSDELSRTPSNRSAKRRSHSFSSERLSDYLQDDQHQS